MHKSYYKNDPVVFRDRWIRQCGMDIKTFNEGFVVMSCSCEEECQGDGYIAVSHSQVKHEEFFGGSTLLLQPYNE